jgi:hypothetical protein
MTGGGGFFSPRYGQEDFKKIIAETRSTTQNDDVEVKVNSLINDYLSRCTRDTKLTSERLADIKDVLKDGYEGTFDTRFGGSVMKQTYVDGLSDVDVLVLIDRTELADSTPNEVLNYMKRTIDDAKIKDVESTKVGRLALTLTYKNGDEIQLLPTLRKGEGFKIPSSESKEVWSPVIRPDKFAEKLTAVNQQNSNKVVRIIKLAKGIMSKLPEDQRLRSYHIESLAIEAFKNNSQPLSNKEMLMQFFISSKERVKSPIRDKTGQSYHVDDYLGAESSLERAKASYNMERIYKRMKRASEQGNTEEWESILGDSND